MVLQAKRTVGGIAGVVLALLFSFCSWGSHEMENCTMGDTDGYLTALVFGGPLALVAMFLLWRSRRAVGVTVYLGAALVLVASGALLLLDLLPWLVSTTFAGNHPCGADYNSYLPELSGIRYYLPAVHVLVVGLLFAFACVPIVGALRRAV